MTCLQSWQDGTDKTPSTGEVGSAGRMYAVFRECYADTLAFSETIKICGGKDLLEPLQRRLNHLGGDAATAFI